jgi:hypothetical protein
MLLTKELLNFGIDFYPNWRYAPPPKREWSNLCMNGVGKCGRLKDLINESQNPIPSTEMRRGKKRAEIRQAKSVKKSGRLNSQRRNKICCKNS